MKRIGIVCSKFNEEITDRMLETAMRHAVDRHAVVVKVLRVPGAFEIPFAVLKLLEQPNIDGVVTLGAIIQGETGHDEVIANAIGPELVKLSLRYRKPVALGVTGPRMTYAQAKARAVPVALRGVEAVLEMIELNHWHPNYSGKPAAVGKPVARKKASKRRR